MLEIFGISYIIDHCTTVLKRQNEELLYKKYVTDSLKAAVNNQVNKEKYTLSKRFIEMIIPSKEAENDDRTAEDVIAHINAKLGELHVTTSDDTESRSGTGQQ